MQLLVALMSQVLKMTLKILSLLLIFFELNVVSILTRKNLSASCLKKNKIFSSLNMNLNEYFFDLFVCLVQFVKCPKYVNVPIFRFSQKLIGFFCWLSCPTMFIQSRICFGPPFRTGYLIIVKVFLQIIILNRFLKYLKR